MPIISIPPQTLSYFNIPYPPAGKVKIILEASSPVDIFICTEQQRIGINNLAAAQMLGVTALGGQTKIDNFIVPLPESWRGTNWNFMIGNPSADAHAAVYFLVSNI